jgi:hypothetical protein
VSGPVVGAGAVPPAAAAAVLRFHSRIEKRDTPNLFSVAVGPCFAAYSRISARCDGV